MKVDDVLIAGASYAGLACAHEASSRGLSCRILEGKKSASCKIRTTGILVKEAEQVFNFPQRFLRDIKGVRLYGPSLDYIDLRSPGYSFYAADTPGLMDWFASTVQAKGTKIEFAEKFSEAKRHADSLEINQKYRARFVVGADGARSQVAKQFGLSQNKKFLTGMEFEYLGIDYLDRDYLHVFIDSNIAPGYIAWVVPGVEMTQVGMAATYPHQLDMPALLNKLKPLHDFTHVPVMETRGGVIPVGGVLPKLGDDRVLLLGDAAGTVSPLTAGGIHKALEHGLRAAGCIDDYLQGRGEIPVAAMQPYYPNYRFKKLLRMMADGPVPNYLLDEFVGSPVFRRFAQLIFFHHRGLFSKQAWGELLPRKSG